MERVAEFYQLMDESRIIRRDMAASYLKKLVQPTHLEFLKRIAATISNAPRDQEGVLHLKDDQGRSVLVKDNYESSELQKDILFFEHGEPLFLQYLSEIHTGFGEELQLVCDFIGSEPYDAFFTDRDGTVNNYCGRYRSSVQSAYNAVYLSRFGRTVRQAPVILTAAPLMETGIRELCVMPEPLFLLAGSKGGEYCSFEGQRVSRPLPARVAEAMDNLNARVEELLQHPENHVFTQIGSGFQKKLGETTLSYQDVFGSIPAHDSQRLFEAVHRIVSDMRNAGHHIRVEDTGKDLELIPTSDGEVDGEQGNGGELSHFTKGDGLRFLVQELELHLSGKRILVCGDTESDLPMVEAALSLGGEVSTVFVTSDKDLRRRVYETGARCEFVSTPDVLVAALDRSALA
ncbi:MAG: trehalose 6-phosphate synthase [Spirochaetaceae bacterium]|nr:MAG: trehalose 6-phosphate synthase [Spirochaetaceae bacterium]